MPGLGGGTLRIACRSAGYRSGRGPKKGRVGSQTSW